jgi:hypothetical protein
MICQHGNKGKNKGKMDGSNPGLKGQSWRRRVRSFLLIIVVLVGLGSIVATGGGSGGGSSGSSGSVAGSGK